MNGALKDQLTQVLEDIIFSPHSIFCDNQESLEHVIARWNEVAPEEYKFKENSSYKTILKSLVKLSTELVHEDFHRWVCQILSKNDMGGDILDDYLYTFPAILFDKICRLEKNINEMNNADEGNA